MARFLFFVFLIATLGLAAHTWLTDRAARLAPKPELEVNPGKLRIVAIGKDAQLSRTPADAQASAASATACAQLSGINAEVYGRVRDALTALNLGSERMSERRVEEGRRYSVIIPPRQSKSAADTVAAGLRNNGISDVAVQPDNSLSLGVFSNEEPARRVMQQAHDKGFPAAQVVPRAGQLKEATFIVKEPDANLLAELTKLKSTFAGVELKATACP